MEIYKIKKIGQTPKKKELHRYGNFLRPIAPYLSKIFIVMNLSPTIASLLSIFISLGSSLLFLYGNPYLILLGLITYHIAYLFDIIDGQVARIQKKSNVSGAYLDSINHFFNIPIMFLCISIGIFNRTNSIAYIYLGIIISLFCRGSSKYCMYHSIITTFRRVKLGESDRLYIKASNKNKAYKNKVTEILRSLFIFPNIIGIFLLLIILNIILTLIFRIDDLVIIKYAVILYAILYPVLDIGEIYLNYKRKKAGEMYKDFFEDGKE